MNILTNNDRIEAIGDQLRAKIASKFTASTFLAGFALTILSSQVFLIWQSSVLPLLFPLSVGTIAGAVVLFFYAVLRLDELTMPKRFWDESDGAIDTGYLSREGYLSDDDLWELRKQMIFYWAKLTIVATWMTGIGVIAMLIPINPPCTMSMNSLRICAFILTVLGPVLAFVYQWIVIVIAKNSKDDTKKLKQLMRRID